MNIYHCEVCGEVLTLKRGKFFCMKCDDDETVLQVILNLEYLGLAEITLGQKEELDHE